MPRENHAIAISMELERHKLIHHFMEPFASPGTLIQVPLNINKRRLAALQAKHGVNTPLEVVKRLVSGLPAPTGVEVEVREAAELSQMTRGRASELATLRRMEERRRANRPNIPVPIGLTNIRRREEPVEKEQPLPRAIHINIAKK